eukprot:m.10890 g.10890  ORF g.10890 m.10890 type:complete len:119 (-) comp8544_c0_seq1:19-375(-)
MIRVESVVKFGVATLFGLCLYVLHGWIEGGFGVFNAAFTACDQTQNQEFHKMGADGHDRMASRHGEGWEVNPECQSLVMYQYILYIMALAIVVLLAYIVGLPAASGGHCAVVRTMEVV